MKEEVKKQNPETVELGIDFKLLGEITSSFGKSATRRDLLI